MCFAPSGLCARVHVLKKQYEIDLQYLATTFVQKRQRRRSCGNFLNYCQHSIQINLPEK